MPLGRLVGLSRRDDSINESIENVARWHISAIRRRKNGEILQVKHIEFGWVTVGEYYKLQKLHELVPFVLQAIEGGYRLKAAVWQITISIDVLGSGVTLPIGVILVTIAIALYIADSLAGNQTYALIDLASLALPFGEIWLLWRGASAFLGGTTAAATGIINVVDKLGIIQQGALDEKFAIQMIQDPIFAFLNFLGLSKLPPPSTSSGYSAPGSGGQTTEFYFVTEGVVCQAGYTLLTNPNNGNRLWLCALDSAVTTFLTQGSGWAIVRSPGGSTSKGV